MNSLPGREFPAEIGGRVAEPSFVLGCGDITEWPTAAAKKVDRDRDINFVQLPWPAPNGSHEVTVIRITSNRLLAVPYQYETKAWSNVGGRALNIPIRGPTSDSGRKG